LPGEGWTLAGKDGTEAGKGWTEQAGMTRSLIDFKK
jgi:hypothetical protein